MTHDRTRRWWLTLSIGLLGVSLTLAPAAVIAAGSRTIDILAASYDPATFSVEAGTTIVFQNTSTFPHTVTSDSGVFDTGMIAVGESKSITLQAPGAYPFHCEFHGAVGGVGQSGTITVTAAAGTASASAPPTDEALPGANQSGFAMPILLVAVIATIVLALVGEGRRGSVPRR